MPTTCQDSFPDRGGWYGFGARSCGHHFPMWSMSAELEERQQLLLFCRMAVGSALKRPICKLFLQSSQQASCNKSLLLKLTRTLLPVSKHGQYTLLAIPFLMYPFFFPPNQVTTHGSRIYNPFFLAKPQAFPFLKCNLRFTLHEAILDGFKNTSHFLWNCNLDT